MTIKQENGYTKIMTINQVHEFYLTSIYDQEVTKVMKPHK